MLSTAAHKDTGFSQRIDHSGIPAEHLRIALANAEHNPDGQVFPWQDPYPLAGQTVYTDGKLWIVTAVQRPLSVGSEAVRAPELDIVKLVGEGHDEELMSCRGCLRPVTWTQHDEDWLGRE